MELQIKNSVTAAVNKWIKPENAERSASKLASRSGVNAAYVSNIKNGKYSVGSTPIADGHFYKLADFLGLSLREEDDELHFDTHNFNFIQNVCKSAQRKKKIVLMDSPKSGLGKTHGLEYYHTYNDKVLYIKCTSSMGAADLLNEILEKLQIKTKLVGNKKKLNAIREKLVSSPGYLLIIDEAEDVKSSIDKVIKEIIDFLYNRIAVIVCGMGLIEKINHRANKGRMGYPQLKRRLFSNRVIIPTIQHSEITKICEANGISNKSAHKWFVNNVEDFQMLSEYIKDALTLSKKDKKAIDADFLADLFNIY